MELTTFADRIERALRESGTTAADVARATGLSRAAVSKWVSGQTANVRPDNLFKAADYLRVNPRWLATGQGEPWEEDYNRILATLPREERAHARAVLQAMEDRARYSHD